ncbi:MAG: YbaK/EbsC family protein [Pseudomonadota bacterium]
MTLPRAALRVADALGAAGLPTGIREMPASTRTAEEAAQACGCPLGAIVKSLVFRTGDDGVLILTSGANRVHEKRVGRRLGIPLARAGAGWVRDTTGFAIGGIPPLGHATAMTVVMDQDLLAFDTVWAAAGTPNAVFPCDPEALAKAAGARIIDVS